MSNRISSKAVSLTFGVLVLLFAVGFYIFAAWTEPSQTPPAGNVSAPLNVGSTAQTKTGDLTLPKLYLNAGGNEGNIYSANLIQGYNDLNLQGDSANAVGLYIGRTGDQRLSVYFSGTERWRIDSAGSLTIGLVPWTRLVSFPTACPADQYVTAVGSSLACSTPGGGGTVTSITAGTGLTASPSSPITGIGTLNVGAGSGITVAADTVSVKNISFACSKRISQNFEY
jgi:hypothetical protein